MAEEGEYKINNLYQGGYSSLDSGTYSPSGIYTGHRLHSGELGAPTKADTANQIAQVNMLLNQGIIPIEVAVMNPDVFDAIPKEHFKEINRMAKLTGADISVHAPLIEASGMTDQGWEEASRELAEKQLMSIIDRTAPLNEKGKMSITFHGAVKIPGTEYAMTPEGKKEVEKLYIVNQETGKIESVLKKEERFYPEHPLAEEKGIKSISSPREELDIANSTSWRNALSQLVHHKEDTDKLINENFRLIQPALAEIQQHPEKARLLAAGFTPTQREAYERIRSARHFLSDTQSALNALFNKAYKFGDNEDKAFLKEASEEYKKCLAQNPADIQVQSQAISGVLSALESMRPKLYETVEAFALEKSAKTFANAAFHGFKEYKDKAPVINIENVFPGMAFTPAEDWRNLIKESREQFVKKAVSEGYGESRAREEAERLIGATLDVGHLNVARKKGYGEKELLEEVKKISKDVKHVHLTDNFGYGDTHLPPGMGNVPVKEIMEELEKQGYGGKKIVEAPGWPQHFGTSPFPYILEAFGSSLYPGVGLQNTYSGGFGRMLPQVHYETFGAGFSQLPPELGGQRPGAEGSRMSGRSME